MRWNVDAILDSLDTLTIYDFASKVEIQTGPKAGQMFDMSSSLIAKYVWQVLFPEHDPEHEYDEVIITGPSQCGKTLSLMIPAAYILGVLGESLIFSAPVLPVITSKWQTDIFPLFRTHPALQGLLTGKALDTAPLLQSTGSYQFANQAFLRLISTGASDRAKASFTARNVIVTEFGGVTKTKTSEETDPIGQLKARTRSYGMRKRFILDSTGTTTKGIVEQRFLSGTQSTIRAACPHCHEKITPTRDDFRIDKEPRFECPKCAGKINEEARRRMIRAEQIHHAGGIDAPNFSFRLPAFFNQFVDLAQFAREEKQLAQEQPGSPAAENKKRELLNFLWGEAYEVPAPEELDISLLDQPDDAYTSRDTIRTRIPAWVETVVLGADIQLRQHYWTLCGWGKIDGKLTGHVIDYGKYQTGYEETRGELTKDQLVAQSLVNFITEMRGVYNIDLAITDIGYLFSSLILTTNRYGKKLRWFGAHGQPTGWRAKSEVYPRSSEYAVVQELEAAQVARRKKDKAIYVRHESSNERYHLLELFRTGRYQLFTPAPSETHTEYLTSLDSHFQIIDPLTGEVRWDKRHGTSDHYLDSAILTLTAYKLLNPAYRFGTDSNVGTAAATRSIIDTQHSAVARNTAVPMRPGARKIQPRRIIRRR